ncbi:MAG: zinc ribbon domain-containing protein [Longimicrobiales bacterium]|nr:zinc ribbon domain-containing protein [Longimicrobiales bacterium]
MTTPACPGCGAPANGNFCSSCGAALSARSCPSCGASAEPGARFCTGCGAGLGTGERDGSTSAPPPSTGAPPRQGAQAAASEGGAKSQLGWWMAGTMLVFLLSVVAYPILVPQKGLEVNPGPTGGAQAQFGNANAVDLGSMTPIEAANRLFDRVMTLYEAGDTGQVAFFLPMATAAYEQAEPLEADGLYHLSTLQRLSGDPESAVETARRIVDETPTHLFGLSEMAEATLALGDTARAREYFQAVLDNWAAEQAIARPAYQMHPAVMPSLRESADSGARND